ncbi:MAG: transcriptional repressor [Clostridiales bacterium]|nr:transcriptional repressor [Clostridiales bacterium]
MKAQRFSKQRELIYRTVKGTDRHPDAEWVYREARKSMPGISLGTVYRNLRQMAEQNRLITVETTDNSQRFDADVSAHAHFVCDACGAICDLFLPAEIPAAVRDAGCRVRQEKRVFYGLCAACARGVDR